MSEKQGKKAFGFDTSGKRIQKWVDEQKELIKGKEVSWAKVLELSNELIDGAEEMVQKTMPSPTPAPVFLVLYVLVNQRTTFNLIARLGLDIVKLSEQVAETQKMCKELKLATRGLPQD